MSAFRISDSDFDVYALIDDSVCDLLEDFRGYSHADEPLVNYYLAVFLVRLLNVCLLLNLI